MSKAVTLKGCRLIYAGKAKGNCLIRNRQKAKASTKEAGGRRLFDLISLFGEISAIETPRPFELFGVQFAQINQNGSI